MLPGLFRSNVGIAIAVLAAVLVLSGLAHLVLGREGMADGTKAPDATAPATSDGAATATEEPTAAADEGESMDPQPSESATDPNASFCSVEQSLAEREQACLALDKDGCGLADCCVWATATAGDKTQQLCVAGGASGPTFLSEAGSSSLHNITAYDHGGKSYAQQAPPKTAKQSAAKTNPTEAVWQELTGANVPVALE